MRATNSSSVHDRVMSWVSHMTAHESVTASNQEVKHCLTFFEKCNSIKSMMPRRHTLGTFSLNRHNVGSSRLPYVLMAMHSDLFSKLPTGQKGSQAMSNSCLF